MAVRQYIGARYVPRFVGNYDPTQSYEALDVVDNGSGTSYIAKIPTPANTPLTDTDHWFLYGSTSGAILNLQQQIDDMNDGTVPGSLQEQINTNTSDITALTKGKDCIILAASYGNFPSTSDNCMINLEALLANTYDNIYSGVVAGGKFSDGSYLTLLQSITSANNDIVKDIIIIGIANDMNDTFSDVLTAMTAFKTYCNTTYPNASISIAPVSTRTDKDSILPLWTLYKNMCDSVKTHGMAIMNNIYHILALNCGKYIGSDGIHPTSAGAALIAESIFNNIVTGSFKKTEETNRITVGAYHTNINGISFYTEYISINNDNAKIAVSTNFSIDTNLSIGTVFGNLALFECMSILKNMLYGLSTDPSPYITLDGTITDMTTGVSSPISVVVKENNGTPWYCINSRTGAAITITAGNWQALRVDGIIPFEYV